MGRRLSTNRILAHTWDLIIHLKQTSGSDAV